MTLFKCKKFVSPKPLGWNVMRSRAGFTLLELLVIITIIGILSAVGIVNLPRDKIQVREATRVITADINRARSEAIRLNTKTEVVFNTISDCYTLSEIADQDGNLLSSPKKVLERCVGAEFPLTDLSSASFTSGSKVRFDGRGLPESDTGAFSSGSVTVAAKGRSDASLRIVMETQGRLRIEKVQ